MLTWFYKLGIFNARETDEPDSSIYSFHNSYSFSYGIVGSYLLDHYNTDIMRQSRKLIIIKEANEMASEMLKEYIVMELVEPEIKVPREMNSVQCLFFVDFIYDVKHEYFGRIEYKISEFGQDYKIIINLMNPEADVEKIRIFPDFEPKKIIGTYDYISPPHYQSYKGKEVYELMIELWGEDAYVLHCEMCAFKYRMRAGAKPEQSVERDIQKAEWYEKMAQTLKKPENISKHE